jgi:hypothetical protein
MHRSHYVISILLVVLYVCLATFYLFVVPAGESPDEPSHLQCIEQVTRYNRIPVVDPPPRGDVWWARERIISGLVCAHMPLYYFMAGYTQQITERISGEPAHYEFPPDNPGWETGQSSAMFVHSRKDSFFTLAQPLSLVVLRIESILLGLMSIAGAYYAACRIAPGASNAAIAAIALVAGWPQFLFMSRAINNDVLANALAVGVLVLLLDLGKPYRFVFASALTALAVLSKLTMTFFICAVGFTFLLETFASRERSPYLKAGIISLVILGSLVVLLLLHPILRSHIIWSRATIAGINPAACTFAYWVNVLHATIQSGWARFGWMNVLTPDFQAYTWWAVLAVTGAAGICRGASSKARTPRLATYIGCMWVASFFVQYIIINVNRFQPQFRYILPVVPMLAAFAGSGLALILKRLKFPEPLAVLAIASVLILANLWIVFRVLGPAYYS